MTLTREMQSETRMSEREFQALLDRANRLSEEARTWTEAERRRRERELNALTDMIVREVRQRTFAGT